ncbi:MAG: DsbA family protein [Gammaproteobacteria bacterium]|nr:DsbA family protein [Gammaproteobacteria bacterium]
MKKPELKISILTDYICPFCFIGHLRLDALRELYDLKINWCFIEIHPETPQQGHSVKMLNYDNDAWDEMTKNLMQLADEEGINICEQTIITNSRKALLLSEATKPLGADVFYPLHEQLFSAYFIEGKNIGDENILRDIAKQNNIPENLINQAWSDKYANGPADSVPSSLLPYLQYAGAIQAKSVPTFIIGKEILNGVVTREKLLQAAKKATHNDENKEKLN